MLDPLHHSARGDQRHDWIFLDDAGFEGHYVKTRDLVPPIQRGGRLVAPERKVRTNLIAQIRLDGKFENQIHAVIQEHPNREPIIKGAVYNLRR